MNRRSRLRRSTAPVVLGAALAVLLPPTLPVGLAGQSANGPSDSTAAALDTAGSERIRPGDIVLLTVWREEDLTGEFPVNQFGTVVLPMVGEYDVRGETQRSFREKVLEAFRRSLANPAIEVTVLRRVRVLGEVNEPGIYPLDPTMTVADALAMAKGRTPNGVENVVILRRGEEVIDADLRLDVRVSESPIRSGDELVVPRRSWLDRNAAAVLAGVPALIGVLVTIIAR